MNKLTLLLIHPTHSLTLGLIPKAPTPMSLGLTTWLTTLSRGWSCPDSKTYGFWVILVSL